MFACPAILACTDLCHDAWHQFQLAVMRPSCTAFSCRLWANFQPCSQFKWTSWSVLQKLHVLKKILRNSRVSWSQDIQLPLVLKHEAMKGLRDGGIWTVWDLSNPSDCTRSPFSTAQLVTNLGVMSLGTEKWPKSCGSLLAISTAWPKERALYLIYSHGIWLPFWVTVAVCYTPVFKRIMCFPKHRNQASEFSFANSFWHFALRRRNDSICWFGEVVRFWSALDTIQSTCEV